MPSEKDERTYIRVHDGMPDHPKVEALSDKAFRLLIATWCWCSRHLTDGRVPLAVWRKRGTPKARRELVDAGLVEMHDDHVMMHDYLDHQRSAEEVAERKAAKRRAGALGNHNRWHVPRGVYDEQCPVCVADGPKLPSQPGSHLRSHVRPVDNSKFGNESNISDANDTSDHNDLLPEYDTVDSSQSRHLETVIPAETDSEQPKTASQLRSQKGSQNGRKTSPETETETETEKRGEDLRGNVTTRARDFPPPKTLNGPRPDERCPRHRDVDDVPPCGQCADARRAAQAWDSAREHQRQQLADELEQARRDPRMRCHHGTDAGLYIRPDTGTSPCALCRHEALRAS